MTAGEYVNVFSSVARTATPTAVNVDTGAHRGMVLEIDVTATSATPSITVNINHIGINGTQLLLASAAITTVSTTFLTVYPGLTDVANTVANNILSMETEIEVVHADADSITYSVNAQLIP